MKVLAERLNQKRMPKVRKGFRIRPEVANILKNFIDAAKKEFGLDVVTETDIFEDGMICLWNQFKSGEITLQDIFGKFE